MLRMKCGQDKCMAAMKTQPLVYHLPCHTASSNESLAQLSPYFGVPTRKTVQGLERVPQSEEVDVLTKFLRNMLLSYKKTSSATYTDEDSFLCHNFVAAFHFSVDERKYFPGLYDQYADIVGTDWHKKISTYKNMHRFSQKKMLYRTRNYKHSKITKRRLCLRREHSLLMKFQSCLRFNQYKFQSEIMAKRQNFISLPSLKKRIKLFSNNDLPQTQMVFSKSDSTLMNNSNHRVKEISHGMDKVGEVNGDAFGVRSSETTEDGTDGPTSDEFITGTNHSTRSISYVSATTSTEMNEEEGIYNVSTETLGNLQSGVKHCGNVAEFRRGDKIGKKASLKKRNCETFSQDVRSEFHDVDSDNEEIGNAPEFRHGEKSSKKAPVKKRNYKAFPQTIRSEFHKVHPGNEETGSDPDFRSEDKSSKEASLKNRHYEGFSQFVRSKVHEVHSGKEEIGTSSELLFKNIPIFHSQSITNSKKRQICLPPLTKSQEAYIKKIGNVEAGYDADCDTADSESENSNSDLEDWLDILLFNSKTDVRSKSKSTQYTSVSEVDSKHFSSYFSITNDKSRSELCLSTSTISECTSEHKIKRCNSGSILNTMSQRKVLAETDIAQRHLSLDDRKVLNSADTIDIQRQSTKASVSMNTSSEYMTGVESKSCNSQGSMINSTLSLPKFCISARANSEYSYEADRSAASSNSYIKMLPPINLGTGCYWRGNDQPIGRHFTVLHENKKCFKDSLSELEIRENVADQSTKPKKVLEKQEISIPAKQISSTSATGPLCRTCVFKCGLLPHNGKTVRGQEILQHLLETDKKSKKQESKQCLSQMDKKSKFCSKCRSLFTKNA